MADRRLPSWRKVWFQTHWFLGITAGLVMMVVGVTGALLSYQDGIMRLLNPGVLTVAPSDEPHLSPAALIRRVEAESGARVTFLGLSGEANRSARVVLAPRDGPQAAGGRPTGEPHQADPRSGALLGTPVGNGFFRSVRELHRWLLASGEARQWGRVIVGISTIALVILAATGLYLRWPRRPLDIGTWFRIDPKLRGRGLLWRLHAVIGTWVLPLYLLAGLTGLYWSFDWYRDALYTLSGAPRPGGEAPRRPAAPAQPPMQPQADPRPGGEPGATPPREGRPEGRGEGRGERARPAPLDLDTAWATFRREVPAYASATLRPPGPGQPLRITYVLPDASHDAARNTIAIDTAGAVTEHRRYADQPLAHRLMGSMLALHSGEFFGPVGTALMMVASLVMPLFGVTGILLYLGRRKLRAANRGVRRRGAVQAAAE